MAAKLGWEGVMKWESPANGQVQALLEVFHDPVDERRCCSIEINVNDAIRVTRINVLSYQPEVMQAPAVCMTMDACRMTAQWLQDSKRPELHHIRLLPALSLYPAASQGLCFIT